MQTDSDEILGTDTSGLNAILCAERRRATLASLESAAFVDFHTVQRLRRHLAENGSIDQEEAETLFSVERRGISTCPEWRDFFIETIAEFVLWHQRPTAVLTEAQARWLLAQADRTRTWSAFAILITVLEEVQTAPRWFAPTVRDRAEQGWPGLSAAAAAAA